MANGLELRHLRYFLALANELHFGRAANRLHVSQPLLSRQIRELERLLAVRLLLRTRPAVELTPAGVQFREHAREILEHMERGIRATQKASAEPDRLTLALEPCSAVHGFSELLARLRSQRPAVHLQVRELPVSEHVQLLCAGEIDLAYAHRNDYSDGIRFVQLDAEPLRAALPSGHLLARRRKVYLPDLSGEPFVFWPPALAPRCHEFILGILREQGIDPRPRHLAPDHRTLLEMVAAGLGWTVAPACAKNVRAPGVVFREMQGVSASIELGVSFLRANLDRRLQSVLALFQTWARADSTLIEATHLQAGARSR